MPSGPMINPNVDQRLFDFDEDVIDADGGVVPALRSVADDDGEETKQKKKYRWRTTRETRNRVVFWAGKNTDQLQGKTINQIEKELKKHFPELPSRQTLVRILLDCGVTLKTAPAAKKQVYGDYCTKASAARIARRTGAAGMALTEALATLVDALNASNCLKSEVATTVAEKLYQSYVLHTSLRHRRILPPSNELLRLHWETAGGFEQVIPTYDQDVDSGNTAG